MSCLGCLTGSCAIPDPFSEAVAQGRGQEVAELLRQDVTLAQRKTLVKRDSPWHVAARCGHVEVLQALADAVLNGIRSSLMLTSSLRRMVTAAQTPMDLLAGFLRHRCMGGYTPLMLAAMQGHAEAVMYLLCIGSDVWQCDWGGMTALHHAAIKGSVPIIRELLQDPPPPTRRALRVLQPDARLADVLDASGWTPLHYAVHEKKEEAVAALLLMDANLIARTFVYHPTYETYAPPGSTPLHIAAALGSLPLIKLLLRAHYESSASLIPSQLATVERRRRQRTNPDPRLVLTRTGRLPFHLAVRCGHRDVLEWLDPSIPLMFLLGGSDDAVPGELSVVSVPRLSVLAAAALHASLERDLKSVGHQLEECKKQKEEALNAEAPSKFRSHVSGLGSMLSRVIMVGKVDDGGAAEKKRGKKQRRRKGLKKGDRVKGDTSPLPDEPRRLMAVLAAGMNIHRLPSDYLSLNQRMGITIPSNPSRNHVARLVRARSLPRHSLDSVQSTDIHSLLAHLAPGQRYTLRLETGDCNATANQIRGPRGTSVTATFGPRPQRSLPTDELVTLVQEALRHSASDAKDPLKQSYSNEAPSAEICSSNDVPSADGGAFFLTSTFCERGENRISDPVAASPRPAVTETCVRVGDMGGSEVDPNLEAADEAPRPRSDSDQQLPPEILKDSPSAATRNLDEETSHVKKEGESCEAGGTSVSFSSHPEGPQSSSSMMITPSTQAPEFTSPSFLGALPGGVPCILEPRPDPSPDAAQSCMVRQDMSSLLQDMDTGSVQYHRDLRPPAGKGQSSEGGGSGRLSITSNSGARRKISNPGVVHGEMGQQQNCVLPSLQEGEPPPQVVAQAATSQGEGNAHPLTDLGAAESLLQDSLLTGTTGLNFLQSLARPFRMMTSRVIPIQQKTNSKGKEAAEKLAQEDSCSDSDYSVTGSVDDTIVYDKPEPATTVEADEEPEDGDTCPVCLDEVPDVQLVKCRHKLCLGCAKDLCKRHNLTPALCPYCRSIIVGFAVVGKSKTIF